MRSAHVSHVQSLRNSRQEMISIQDKMDRNVFILKVERLDGLGFSFAGSYRQDFHL